MHSEPVVSIVIVTWNCKAYALECLTSLKGQMDGIPQEVIVVDNASRDGTPELIEEQFAEVRLVRSQVNLGFARANNVGIRLTTGRYICLINPDVNVHPHCLDRMLRYLEWEPAVGLIGPKMLGRDGKPGRSTMRFPTIWNSFCRALALDSLFRHSRLFGGFLMKDFPHDTTRDVDVLNGWFWMTRRSAMDEVGLLDEQLFMYGDDLDWCRRFQNAEWRVVFYAEAEAVHYGGGTTARAPIPFYIALQRANLQYWEKHQGRTAMVGYAVTTGLHHLARIVGYSFMWIGTKGGRAEAAYKVRRSMAALLWLCGVGSNRLGEIR